MTVMEPATDRLLRWMVISRTLKELGEYARAKRVEIGLWTQSDLSQRRSRSFASAWHCERSARCRCACIETDVAWVGAGYSFGLNRWPMWTDYALLRQQCTTVYYFTGRMGRNTALCRYLVGRPDWGEWGTFVSISRPISVQDCQDNQYFFGHGWYFRWKEYSGQYTWLPVGKHLLPCSWTWTDGGKPEISASAGWAGCSINRWYLKMKSEFMPYTHSIARRPWTESRWFRPCSWIIEWLYTGHGYPLSVPLRALCTGGSGISEHTGRCGRKRCT